MAGQRQSQGEDWPRLASSLDRLAERLLAGEVVFFVGAGFSLDSEGNSTQRLLGRLLARFEGMTQVLRVASMTAWSKAEKNDWTLERVQEQAEDLRAALRSTFDLRDPETEEKLTTDEELSKKHLSILADKYYAFNDWIISAYGQLLAACAACLKLPRQTLAERISRAENAILRELGDSVPLAPIDLEHTFVLDDGPDRSHWGKILFLETLGFADPRIMGGCPLEQDLGAAAQSYRGLLLPRHQVLARLAREGVCPTLLTTNYDLLLEGAYRLAGFSTAQIQDPEAACPPLSLVSYPEMVRIGEAKHFFERARTQRAAQLVKIHGCADRYRVVKEEDSLEAYLPSIVFTFREIQNWREDSWSRDMVSTLLRTRTLVFCGYSAADPVIHDTFRTVYEEMERRWGGVQAAAPEAGTAGEPSEPASERQRLMDRCAQAPAFAFGSTGHREFHVLEVLRAASRAVGVGDPPLDDHPNYLPFHFRASNPEKKAQSPDLDQALLWLHHRTLRHLQIRHLERELSSLLPALLGHPAPSAQMEAVQEAFGQLCRRELETAQAWKNEPQPAFQRIVSWTWHFHAALLRELACSEAAVRRRGPGLHLQNLRRRPWIFPASDRPDWSAWGVVLELALRRLAAHGRGVPTLWHEDSPYLRPESGLRPSLILVPDEGRPAPLRLALRLAGRGRSSRRRSAAGAIAARRTWLLPPGHLPWSCDPYGNTPSARTLWDWACDRFRPQEVGNEIEAWQHGLAYTDLRSPSNKPSQEVERAS